MSWLEIFVPGRVCLFGEHSDWAGGHRRINSALEKGYTIITGTNQGLYARVRRAEGRLVYRLRTPAAGPDPAGAATAPGGATAAGAAAAAGLSLAAAPAFAGRRSHPAGAPALGGATGEGRAPAVAEAAGPKDGEGAREEVFEISMQADALLEAAQRGGFWSYLCGVAYQILTHYHAGGVEIDNYLTDLPIKKGLSSSAAVCVLVTRAFNRLYDLKMTVRGEMDMAYRGEITTPSRCGRMDQGCAYGSRPVLMSHDGDALDVRELPVRSDLHLVIADLGARKDTVRILKDLNRAYPFADDEIQRGVQEYLGPVNKALVERAAEALAAGDAAGVGALMREAQAAFDRYLAPACPEELTAPALHRVLASPRIEPLVYGAKGVGSQGDGTVQFLARDRAAQAELRRLLGSEFGMQSWPLTIARTRAVRRAVITAAGFDVRLFPMSRLIRKEFMPVPSAGGRFKPLILVNIENVLAAGIEEVCIVIRREEEEAFRRFLLEPLAPDYANRLGAEDREYAAGIERLGRRVSFVYQDELNGLGHAVLQAREWAAGEPVLVVLGDHYFLPGEGRPGLGDLLEEFEAAGEPIVGLVRTPEAELHRYGCAGGSWIRAGEILAVSEFVEKPGADYARERLRIPAPSGGDYLTAFGMYAITPRVFEILAEMAGAADAAAASAGAAAALSAAEGALSGPARAAGEVVGGLHGSPARAAGGEARPLVQLTEALDRHRRERGLRGFVFQGRRIDVGVPEGYVSAFEAAAGAARRA